MTDQSIPKIVNEPTIKKDMYMATYIYISKSRWI